MKAPVFHGFLLHVCVFEVKKADFAHLVEVMRLHEFTEASSFLGVEIFHHVASEISMVTLEGSIEEQGSFLLQNV